MTTKTVRKHLNGNAWLVTIGDRAFTRLASPPFGSDFDTIGVEDDGSMRVTYRGVTQNPTDELKSAISSFFDEYVALSNASETVVPKVDDEGRYLGLVNHDTAGIRVTCEPPSENYTWDFEREMWLPNED